MASEARLIRRQAARAASKTANKFDRALRGIDFDELRRQAAEARLDLNLCRDDIEVRIFGSAQDAARRSDDPLPVCALCGKWQLSVPIIAPAWLAAGSVEREALKRHISSLLNR